MRPWIGSWLLRGPYAFQDVQGSFLFCSVYYDMMPGNGGHTQTSEEIAVQDTRENT